MQLLPANLVGRSLQEEWDTFNELVAKEVPEDMVNSVVGAPVTRRII